MWRNCFSKIIGDLIRPLQTIHIDTMGPITPASFPGENKFIIVFIDDHSRCARVYYIKHKSQSGECLQKYLEHTRNLLGKQEKVCYIRSDNGTELTGGHFAEIVRQEKIDSDFAPPYTPELNGTAERFIKTIQKKIRALLIESGLPPKMCMSLGRILYTFLILFVYSERPFGIVWRLRRLFGISRRLSIHLVDFGRSFIILRRSRRLIGILPQYILTNLVDCSIFLGDPWVTLWYTWETAETSLYTFRILGRLRILIRILERSSVLSC